MKHRREMSICYLIDNINSWYQVLFASKRPLQQFPLQSLLTGALGLGVAFSGLCWSLRDGYLLLPWASDQKESRNEFLVTVAGLRNLGNNCFLNCILQSLAGSKCFLQFLQNLLVLDDVGDEQMAETLPLVVSLTSLLEELCLVRDEKTVLNPRSVMLSLAQYIQGFNLTKQQDAAEAFIHLLSSLEKEITEHYIRLQHGGSLADITALSSRIYNQEGAPKELEKWKKLFVGPFDGVIGSHLTCQTCSTMLSVDLEFLRSLPLSPVLDRHADIVEGCSLLDCLKHFTKVERVDNYRCGRCWHTAALKHLSCRPEKDEVKIKRLSDCVKHDSCDCKILFCDDEISWTGISHALKKLSIIKCAKVFCFHLQRASMNCYGEIVKLQGHVSFPLFLDLSTFVEPAKKIGQLASVNYMRNNNTNVHDCTFIPPKSHLLRQQQLRMLPHLCRFVGQNPSVVSLSESKLEEPSCELSGNKLLEAASVVAGLNQACIIPERGYIEMVEISTSRSSVSCMYYLCSVVEHYGKPGSGHYAVYRKVGSQLSAGSTRKATDFLNGSWVYISDSEVKCVSEEDVLTAEATMLFYEKVEAHIHESESTSLT